jgi:predicted peptidase
MATQYREELIYSFLRRRLDRKEKLELHTGYDAERHIDEETEEEIRYELYKYMKSRVTWYKIIQRLHDEAENVGTDTDEEGSSPGGDDSDD